MRIGTKNIGTFEVVSGQIIVSDPCYKLDTDCQGILDNVLNGQWTANVVQINDGSWGDRNGYLCACHESYDHLWPAETIKNLGKLENIDVGVDSGQAGIFDLSHYRDEDVATDDQFIKPEEKLCGNELWYDLNCDATLKTEFGAGVIPFGVVSRSGYGDGCYRCLTVKWSGKIVAVMIDFGLEDEVIEKEVEEEETW